MSSLRHAVLGAGGVGGTIAACLARFDVDVTLVVRAHSLAQYPERLSLESPFGNFSVPLARADEVPPCDVLWITVKATQLSSALDSVIRPEAVGRMVPLLNGVDHLVLLREKYGQERVIAATIAGEMERVGPGHFVHRSPFLRLEVSSAGRELLGNSLDGLKTFGWECRFIDDEPTLIWSKVVFLGPLALTTTAADRPTGGVLSDPVWRGLMESCVKEACAVAQAEGARVKPESVLAGMMKMPSHMRSSMQKDVERGNPPELDAIAGAILRAGARHRIPVPTTERLAAMVERRSAEQPLGSKRPA
jgi:2-dehydropantoate 2-reductase